MAESFGGCQVVRKYGVWYPVRAGRPYRIHVPMIENFAVELEYEYGTGFGEAREVIKHPSMLGDIRSPYEGSVRLVLVQLFEEMIHARPNQVAAGSDQCAQPGPGWTDPEV